MSFAVTIKEGRPEMSFQSGNDLLTNVILSLEIAQGSFFADPAFGLRQRPQAKRTLKTARLIKGDIEQALQWLLEIGKAAEIKVTMELDDQDRRRIKALVEVTAASGNVVSYQKFVEVV